MRKQTFGALILATLLLVSLTTSAISVAASSFELGKLQEKPDWAGGPGGPTGGGGGGGDADTDTYELHVEIDYMPGHAPTQEVLDYVVNYYFTEGISVTFYVDDDGGFSDEVFDPTPNNGITEEDFWSIEAIFNDNDNGYFDNWKWVLFGTTVEGDEGEAGVAGYCWIVVRGDDVVAGNYIYMADEATDDWAVENGIAPYGAEATVLMHELGHSIGIGKVIRVWGITYEDYDPDLSSVMAYLTGANTGRYGAWYYSGEYWATRNMKYYKEKIAA